MCPVSCGQLQGGMASRPTRSSKMRKGDEHDERVIWVTHEHISFSDPDRLEGCRKDRAPPPLTLAFLLGKERVFYLRRTKRSDDAVEPAGLQHMHGRW